jgi:hypothetical protein
MFLLMVNDPLLAKAMERRDAARREADSWDDWIKRYLELGGANASVPRQPRAAGAAVKKQRPDVIRSLDLIRTLLAAADRPVPIAVLLDEMDQRQVPIGGENRTNTLDSRLRYYKEFRKIPNRGWWLADRPIPSPNGSAAGTHQELPAAPEVSHPEP